MLLAEAGVTSADPTMTFATGGSLESVAGELWMANLTTLGIDPSMQPMAREAPASPGQV